MQYDKRRKVFVIEDDDGLEIEVPAVMEVCGRCQGTGSHVHPGIDSHGITEDEWNGPDWSPEEQEMYLTGGYDVPCEECDGANVVPVPDAERMTDAQRTLVEDWQASEAEYAAICAMERRCGC